MGEGHIMQPSTSAIRELRHQSTKWHLLTPVRRLRFRLDLFDVRGEHSSLEVGGSSSNKNIVRMPINRQNSGTNRLLDVFANPPFVLFLEITDGDESALSSTHFPPFFL